MDLELKTLFRFKDQCVSDILNYVLDYLKKKNLLDADFAKIFSTTRGQ